MHHASLQSSLLDIIRGPIHILHLNNKFSKPNSMRKRDSHTKIFHVKTPSTPPLVSHFPNIQQFPIPITQRNRPQVAINTSPSKPHKIKTRKATRCLKQRIGFASSARVKVTAAMHVVDIVVKEDVRTTIRTMASGGTVRGGGGEASGA